MLTPGIIFRPETYDAFELGAAVNYNLTEKIFLKGGLNIHFSQESSNGNSDETYSKTIYFVMFGAGYNLTDILSVDIAFHQALNGEFGYIYNLFPDSVSGPKKIINLLKIGIAAVL